MTAIEELVAVLEDLERAGTRVMDLALQGRAVEPWTIYPDEYGIFDRKTHLVAISMADTGRPRALFTVNLWAIGDAYETPGRLKRYAREFRIGVTPWDPRLVRFVNLGALEVLSRVAIDPTPVRVIGKR